MFGYSVAGPNLYAQAQCNGANISLLAHPATPSFEVYGMNATGVAVGDQFIQTLLFFSLYVLNGFGVTMNPCPPLGCMIPLGIFRIRKSMNRAYSISSVKAVRGIK